MTPVLSGRFQTRLFLLLIIGLPVTVLISYLFSAPLWVFALGLAAATSMGFVMDVVCNWLQSKRWDKDWPPVLFFASGVVECIGMLLILQTILPVEFFVSKYAAIHFWVIWFTAYMFIQHVFHIFMPLYKNSGGKIFLSTHILSKLR